MTLSSVPGFSQEAGGCSPLLGARLRPRPLGQTEDPWKALLSELAPWTDKPTTEASEDQCVLDEVT